MIRNNEFQATGGGLNIKRYGAIRSIHSEHQPSKSINIIKFLKHGFNCLIVEAPEGGIIVYNGYTLFAYNPHNETKIGYGFVGLGAVTTLILEILEINHVIPHNKYEFYRHLKHVLAAAMDGANFFQAFMHPNNHGVAGGIGIAITMTSTKVLLDHYRDHPRLQSNTGKVGRFLAECLFHLSAGAGIAGLGFQIYAGFKTPPSPAFNWSVTSALAVTNLAANLIKTYKYHSDSVPYTYRGGHILVSALYGTLIIFFSMILIFDIIEDVDKSGDFKNSWFYYVLGGSVFLGLFVALKKIILDEKEEYRQQLEAQHLAPAIEYDELEEAGQCTRWSDEVSDHCNHLGQQAQQCWAGFWTTSEQNEVDRLGNIVNEDYAQNRNRDDDSVDSLTMKRVY